VEEAALFAHDRTSLDRLHLSGLGLRNVQLHLVWLDPY